MYSKPLDAHKFEESRVSKLKVDLLALSMYVQLFQRSSILLRFLLHTLD